ncbi:MAG: sugar phosphate nucleotidyltransferase, partial [Candidatus Bathyarchaeota archaeon]|nr:sugar phosphate nucleotidyltransferase [Candidatus Bathyarchaeota archaeon]
MKCVILAAGEGSRLFPITENRPKPMLAIGGIPIIDRVIECLRKNKIKELIMIIGHKKEIIQDYLKDGSSFGVNIEYVVQPNFLGTANALNLT